MSNQSGLGFEVFVDTSGTIDKLKDLAAQLPQAEVFALNDTAFIVRDALKSEIKKTFDRPTARTVNSPWVQKATIQQDEKHVLIGLVGWDSGTKNSGKTRVSPAEYLAPQIDGGPRKRKAGESAVYGYTAFPAMGGAGKKFIVPAKGAPLDGFGNLPGNQWVKILSEIKGMAEVGSKSNRTAGSKSKRANFFMSKHKPLIMQRKGDKVTPILVGVASVTYKSKLKLFEVVEEVWNKNISERLIKSIGYAIGKALG